MSALERMPVSRQTSCEAEKCPKERHSPLLGHSPAEQHDSSADRRRDDRCHYPAAERKQPADVIANECASDTNQCGVITPRVDPENWRASHDGPASRSNKKPAMTPIARTRRNITAGSVTCMIQAALEWFGFECCARKLRSCKRGVSNRNCCPQCSARGHHLSIKLL